MNTIARRAIFVAVKVLLMAAASCAIYVGLVASGW